MLEAVDIHKRFDTVVALAGVTLHVEPGEFRALLGGNGSGKSTLAKTIMGTLRPDEGEIRIDNQPTSLRGPRGAFAAGIDATYQELSLLQHLSVRENLELHAAQAGRSIDVSAVEESLALLGLERLAPTMVRDLDLGDRHLVEFAKALLTSPRFLILDEITSALRREQVLLLEKTLEALRPRGIGLLVISHRLDEIQEFCDSATVLRDGKVTLDAPLAGRTLSELVDAMTGGKRAAVMAPGHSSAGVGDTSAATGLRHAPHAAPPREASSPAKAVVPRLEVPLPGISFVGGGGEVVGIAGLAGQGQSELLRRIFGAEHPALTVRIDGEERTLRSPREAVARGIAFLSGDREREMAFRQRSTRENLLVSAWATRRTLDVSAAITRLGLAVRQLGQPMSSLSGGNQQKVAVARSLAVNPLVVLADDPTRGVDVQTRIEIHQWLVELARQGALVVFSSSDDSEFIGLCNRVYVMHSGVIVAHLADEEITQAEIGRAALALVEEPPAAETAGAEPPVAQVPSAEPATHSASGEG